MIRKLILAGSLVAAVLVAGCGHDAGISASVPGDLNPEPDEIGGAVLAPNGIFASAEPLLWRFASLFTSTAYALAPNVVPVGTGVSVTLYSVTEEDISDGKIDSATAVSSPEPTDPQGRFAVALLDGHTVGECGLMLSAGAGPTLTRGFVYANEQDVSAVGEAVVRSILNYIAENPNTSFCNYSAADIEDLTNLVDFISTDIGGASVQELNDNVYAAALASDEVQQLLNEFAAPD